VLPKRNILIESLKTLMTKKLRTINSQGAGNIIILIILGLILILLIVVLGRGVFLTKKYSKLGSLKNEPTTVSNLVNYADQNETGVDINQPVNETSSSISEPVNSDNNQPGQNQQALVYPFENKNMFFGLSLVNSQREWVIKDLDISWLSLQPHALWLTIEDSPGHYDWTSLDREVAHLQTFGIDFTMVVSPIVNVYGSARQEVMNLLAQEVKSGQYNNPSAAFIHLMRDDKIATKYNMRPNDETLSYFVNFVKAAVDRYDGDGKNDMPNLKYAIRNWHLGEEWPEPSFSGPEYIKLLKAAYPAIKAEDPQAKVIFPGLAGNYSQYFAFIDGYITDPDAGVYRKPGEKMGKPYSRELIAKIPWVKTGKPEYENMLKELKGYFDVVDIHLYDPKETFTEGKINYLKAKMNQYGYSVPIWICEGGGPFKNASGDYGEQGDPYFGWSTLKENAEYVVKMHLITAGSGVERQHWGLSTSEGGYWQGPWLTMGLLDSKNNKKPAYYTFKMMREKLRDFTSVKNLGIKDGSGNYTLRLFEVNFADGHKVYVAWNFSDTSATTDLSKYLGQREVKISYIVTETKNNQPVQKSQTKVTSSQVPLNLTPIFIE
jgi:hypothetical protein